MIFKPTFFATTRVKALVASASLVFAVSGLFAADDTETISAVGGGLGERMLYYPHFETELQLRFPDKKVVFNNLCRPGDTPGFRPHPARNSPWAFPGAERFRPEFKIHHGRGHFETPDQWLTRLETDHVLGFFGYSESFSGSDGLAHYEQELEAFVTHTLNQRYNGDSSPQLTLVSPIAFEDLSSRKDLPDGVEENKRLEAYSAVMRKVAKKRGLKFIDLYQPTLDLFSSPESDYTINGFLMNDEGYRFVAKRLVDALYPGSKRKSSADYDHMYAAVEDKNWHWRSDYRILNGVHVFGRRYNPFGDDNYPEELEKIRQMTDLRRAAIDELARTGSGEGIVVDDSKTRELSPIETNYRNPIEFLPEDQALERFKLPEGYQMNLFVSEAQFEDLGSPVQMSFDAKGRMWVAVIPSYPHYRPGDGKPNDKILILEDSDGDGRADTKTVFADGLHMPIGFELAPEGVYVAQQPNLVLLVDEDGDDRADRTEYILHGFDSHDTHHSISSFSAGPEGGIYMAEGRFLHSQVETPYGTERCTDGGVWRFDPRTWKLERYIQTDVSNPWGIAFDDWGELFLADASGGANWWGLPIMAKLPHGREMGKVAQFTTHRVRPTSGAEFVSSGHFPDDVQGDFLINNTIGFLGTKQHMIVSDDEEGFTGELRQDLISSTDPNYRPCELEFGPDGRLYIVDWYNPLIGHMQHSARDPNRDKAHGRIYCLSYPSRNLVTPAEIDGASIETLLENLKLSEYRSRYRSRRELRGRSADELVPAIKSWVANLDKSDTNYERLLLEALWVSWGVGEVDVSLLEKCLNADDFRARTAALTVLRFVYDDVANADDYLRKAIADESPRVRLAALVTASHASEIGPELVVKSLSSPITKWLKPTLNAGLEIYGDEIRKAYEQSGIDLGGDRQLVAYAKGGKRFSFKGKAVEITNLSATDLAQFNMGKEVYHRDGYCGTCHGDDGKGAIEGIYPPVLNSEWVKGNDERLIKLVLKGITGKIEVAGKVYDPATGVPPMPAFEGMLTDEEIAAVLTYVRINFGDRKGVARSISSEAVESVRESTMGKNDFYSVEELLREHPFNEMD
ncbi:PVC-type heme-binding CxxCH protein [Pelagicoccus mobilis]|uniref:C-type cytochrome n=1 Tax=Pelagicoccus mobilis TaxID=415221 RepID=A0A934VS02_9BACT|nr:PVC-type heme-binding CxxCH protein [Pelagicoccus mobilis]MBK1878153.1 c-type cytochrome [Pelagicoccus mobilis]